MYEIDKLMANKGVPIEEESKLVQTYNQFKEVEAKASEKALTWFSKYWEQLLALIFAFLLIGIQQFAEATFDPLFFLKPKFWYDYIPYVMAIWVIIFSVLSGNNKFLIEVDKQYIDAINAIQKHVDDDRLTPYIHEGAKIEDRERKTFAWKTKVSKKIEKIRKRYQIGSVSALMEFVGYTKQKNIQDENGEIKTVEEVFEGDDTIVVYKIKMFQNARKRNLRKRLKFLLNLLDENYIQYNLEHLKVAYDRVTSSILVNGITPSSSHRSTSNYKERFGMTVFEEFGTGFIVFSLTSAVILSLDLIQKEVSWATFVFFIFKAFMLYTYYFRANARSKPIFKKTTVKAVLERVETLDKCKRRVLHKT